ncbi:MAG: S49 family peptidase [Syntrophaceticus schinkii]
MKFSFFEIFWILLITLSLWPLFKHKNIERLRYKAIRSIEQKRKSRVITIIHRQELISILGLPLTRYINIEDSEQVLRAIRLTPDQMPIDILLHTPGGLVLASEQIALALKRHPAKVTVFIPHYAMSGGTMITLAADEIVMDPNAVVGLLILNWVNIQLSLF